MSTNHLLPIIDQNTVLLNVHGFASYEFEASTSVRQLNDNVQFQRVFDCHNRRLNPLIIATFKVFNFEISLYFRFLN